MERKTSQRLKGKKGIALCDPMYLYKVSGATTCTGGAPPTSTLVQNRSPHHTQYAHTQAQTPNTRHQEREKKARDGDEKERERSREREGD